MFAFAALPGTTPHPVVLTELLSLAALVGSRATYRTSASPPPAQRTLQLARRALGPFDIVDELDQLHVAQASSAQQQQQQQPLAIEFAGSANTVRAVGPSNGPSKPTPYVTL